MTSWVVTTYLVANAVSRPQPRSSRGGLAEDFLLICLGLFSVSSCSAHRRGISTLLLFLLQGLAGGRHVTSSVAIDPRGSFPP
jgi:hypothetical protein